MVNGKQLCSVEYKFENSKQGNHTALFLVRDRQGATLSVSYGSAF